VTPMIDIAARAIARSAGGQIVGPGQSRATREFTWEMDGGHLDKFVERHWREYIHAAEFVFEAIRHVPDATGDYGRARRERHG
jgi:hypothetical protein